jgi:hypothetical protein
MNISVSNHYWAIAGATAEVYASKTNTLVPVADPDFVAHGVATPIGTEAELAEVLRGLGSFVPEWLLAAPSFIQPAPGAFSKDQLKAYNGFARYTKRNGGIVVNGIPFPSDVLTQGSLNSAFIYTSDAAVDTWAWKLPDGTFITLDTQGVKDLQSAVTLFGQRCFDCEDGLVASIDAGTTTTLTAIDAAFAAVSNTFTGLAVQRREKKAAPSKKK